LRGGSRSRIFALPIRPDTASNAARAKGPRRLEICKGWHHQGSRDAASFAEALRRRATDSMARAGQGGGVVQLSSLQTGGARTRSVVVAVPCRVDGGQASRLRPQRRDGGESSRSIVCNSVVKRGITVARASWETASMVWRDLQWWSKWLLSWLLAEALAPAQGRESRRRGGKAAKASTKGKRKQGTVVVRLVGGMRVKSCDEIDRGR
jgi:hypothetical protein